jgi:hypothetical protein
VENELDFTASQTKPSMTVLTGKAPGQGIADILKY